MNIEEALAENYYWRHMLGWEEHVDRLMVFLGATSSGDRDLAEAIYGFQQGWGLAADGIMGPVTWGVVASLLGLGVRYGRWRPLGPQTEPVLAQHDIVCLHTMQARFATVDAAWVGRGYGGKEAHFGVRHDGLVHQWQDTRFQADAQLEGNRRALSIETEDKGPAFPPWSSPSDVPPWTHAQIEAVAEIIARCCIEYTIPLMEVQDSRPHRRGIAHHRQGTGTHIVPGGEKWSKGPKACPGKARIAQIPRVIERADEIAQSLVAVQPYYSLQP